MARIAKFTDNHPKLVEIGGKMCALCTCGLSKKHPFCDGRHSLTKTEEEGKLYVYSEEGEQIEVHE